MVAATSARLMRKVVDVAKENCSAPIVPSTTAYGTMIYSMAVVVTTASRAKSTKANSIGV